VHPLLKVVLVLMKVSPALVADLLPFTYTGNTTGAPTYTSANGYNGPYVTFEFTLDTVGSYSFTQEDSGFHPDLALYAVSFNPAKPSINVELDIGNPSGTVVSFSLFLIPGAYIVVDSGTDPSQSGAFTTIIGGPTGAQLTTVPDPSSVVLLASVMAAVWAVRRGRLSSPKHKVRIS
jgi:hypothetical protein